MLGKRKAFQNLPPSRKKRKSSSAIEEISFDFSAREDYLTGFHKRKLLRIKHAKEEAAKKDREDKLAARKILREGRKADLEKHVEAVDIMIREADGAFDSSDEGDQGEENKGEENKGEENEGEEKPWNGIKNHHDPMVDHEDEYLDEDRFTTVTIEAVDVSKDGLKKVAQDERIESEGPGVEVLDEEPQRNAALHRETGSERGKRIWTKETPRVPRKRKRKFRYENKAERKATRYKERLGNKTKARARKE